MQSFLFGSAARGDSDAASDTDVLLVYEREPSESERQIRRGLVSALLNKECAFAEYTSKRLNELFDDGHLFAWHLHCEARPLQVFEDDANDCGFPKPSPYKGARQDIENFTNLLSTCLKSVSEGSSSLVYEAGLGYLAIRNIGMSLSAVLMLAPAFDRYSAFRVAEALGIVMPCDTNTYEVMVAARHASQRGTEPPMIDAEELRQALAAAYAWAHRALEIAHEYTAA